MLDTVQYSWGVTFSFFQSWNQQKSQTAHSDYKEVPVHFFSIKINK